MSDTDLRDLHNNDHKKIEEELYDYGSISDRDKLVVEECLKFIPLEQHDTVKDKFGLKVRPVYDVKNHPLTKACEDLNIKLTLQGYNSGLQANDTRFPIYALCEDFRTLEKLYSHIVQQVMNEMRPHLKSDTVVDSK